MTNKASRTAAPLLGTRALNRATLARQLLLNRVEMTAHDAVEHLLTLTCASRFGGPEEARALVAAVRLALHEARPALSGRRLVTLRVPYADVFAGADRETTLGIVRVRAVTEAP